MSQSCSQVLYQCSQLLSHGDAPWLKCWQFSSMTASSIYNCCSAGSAFPSETRHCYNTYTSISQHSVFCLFEPTLIERHTEISVILPLLPSCYWGNCCSPGRTAAETRTGGQKVTGKARSVSTGPLNWTHFQSILLWSALSVKMFVFKDLSSLFLKSEDFARGWGEKVSLVSYSTKGQALNTPNTELQCLVLAQEAGPSQKHIKWSLTCTKHIPLLDQEILYF